MKRKPALPKLTLPQWCMLVELSRPRANGGNEWLITGRGPLTAATSLARLGLAKCTERITYRAGDVFSLTEAGKLRAKAGP